MRSFPRLIACLLFVFGPTAVAAEPWPARVGRVSLADGGVTMHPGGGDWSDAVVNEPVAAGTSLRTGAQGRAEIRLSGITIALSPDTSIDILRLDDDAVQVAVKSGHVGLSVDRRSAASLEIDTIAGAIRPSAPGRYDIAAAAGLVSKGEAADAAALPDHVPAAMPGAAVLAANGDWASSDDGPVWYPKNLAADWAPFRDGSWRFLPPWGWTWIDGAPWGFAPSHYGRWARIDKRWGWLPGKGGDAASFMPAGVAFLGTPGIGLSHAGGSGPAVAWFPLAPGEAYWPADKGDPPAEIVNAAYKNRRFASAVPRTVFVNGKPVATALVDIPDRRLDVAPAIPGSPQIATPGPHLVAGLPRIVVARSAPQPRIALDPPRRRHAKALIIAHHHRPHTPAPTRFAAAPPHPDRLHRHLAEARHILRQ